MDIRIYPYKTQNDTGSTSESAYPCNTGSLCSSGSVDAPPSKSMAHRLLICAALAEGISHISNCGISEDILATTDCLKALGAVIENGSGSVSGFDPFRSEAAILPCRESGSTLRFLMPICALSGNRMTLTGSRRLMERPLDVYDKLFAENNIILEKSLHLLKKITATAPAAELDGKFPAAAANCKTAAPAPAVEYKTAVPAPAVEIDGEDLAVAAEYEIAAAPFTVKLDGKFPAAAANCKTAAPAPTAEYEGAASASTPATNSGRKQAEPEGKVTVQGRLGSGSFVMKGNVSSQFVSGMLFALPLLEGDSIIRLIPPVESRPYIDMTIKALEMFGVKVYWADTLNSRKSYNSVGCGAFNNSGDDSGDIAVIDSDGNTATIVPDVCTGSIAASDPNSFGTISGINDVNSATATIISDGCTGFTVASDPNSFGTISGINDVNSASATIVPDVCTGSTVASDPNGFGAISGINDVNSATATIISDGCTGSTVASDPNGFGTISGINDVNSVTATIISDGCTGSSDTTGSSASGNHNKECADHSIYIPGGQKYHACDVKAEGDWSGAAYLLALGARVNGLNPESLQGDKVCVNYFRAIEEGRPKLDISACPDLGPVLMAYAALHQGCTLTGTRRLSMKESDRGRAMQTELAKFGVSVDIAEDSIVVHSSGCISENTSAPSCHAGHTPESEVMISRDRHATESQVAGSRDRHTQDSQAARGHAGYTAESEASSCSTRQTTENRAMKCRLRTPSEPLCGHNDHRIVMALAVLCAKTGGVIQGAEAVSKSFPDFFEKLRELGINTEEI